MKKTRGCLAIIERHQANRRVARHGVQTQFAGRGQQLIILLDSSNLQEVAHIIVPAIGQEEENLFWDTLATMHHNQFLLSLHHSQQTVVNRVCDDITLRLTPTI